MKSEFRLMPWALVYLQLMCRMPGGTKCHTVVAEFIRTEGLVKLEAKD